MRMLEQFKNPDDTSSEDDLDDLVEDVEIDGEVVAVGNIDPTDSEGEDGFFVLDEDDESVNSADFEPDSDDSMYDTEVEADKPSDPEAGEKQNDTDSKPSGSSTSRAQRVVSDGTCDSAGESALELNEEDEEDDTVRAMIAAIKKQRTSPPDIKIDDFITDICFHPERDIIALATITGDVCLYKYANEANTLLRNIEVHAKACRDVEFTEDGLQLLTCSKDKSIMVTDMETEKLKRFYESAHDEAINKLYVIDENIFSTGDDGGTVKLWDLRTKEPIFSLKEVEDFISQMLTNGDKKLLLVTSGDGYLTTINIAARKLFVQSEPYEEELHCMGTFRNDSKLVVGTTKGRMYAYNWGQFGYHCDMYPGIKTAIGQMIPITDRIACVAGEEGVVRAVHIAPFRNLGIVGQHKMPVECLDVNTTGELIASSSHNNDVCFWNMKYFEEFEDIKYNEKHNTYKDKQHNLPSSKFTNAGDFFAGLANEPDDDDD